jgi:hypothetical protein
MAILRSYPAAYVSGTHTWTNSTNLVGNTNTFATHAATLAVGIALGARLRYDLSAIPDGATIQNVTCWLAGKVNVAARGFTGVTIRYQNATAPVTVTATAQPLATTDGTYGVNIPWATLAAAGWTLEMLKDPTNTVEFTLTSSTTSTTTTSLQKAYLDVEYTASGMKSLKLFPTLKHTITGEYTNAANVLGDTNLEASRTAASTSDYPVVRVGFNLASLPLNAASIENITVSAQVRSSVTLKRQMNQLDVYRGNTLFMVAWADLISAVNTNGPEWVHRSVSKSSFHSSLTPANLRLWDTSVEWTVTTSATDTTSVTNYIRRLYITIDYKEATQGASPLFRENF